MMSGIRGKDTRPEMLVRRFLHSKGLRYRLHVKDLPGTPDLVFKSARVAIFVHGCYWHRHGGCRFATKPKSNIEFWEKKLSDNSQRDERVISSLVNTGWRVIVIWECGLRKKPEELDLEWLPEEVLKGYAKVMEWPRLS